MRTKFKGLLAAACARNGFLASVYYAFFSNAFYREHQAVLIGQLEYQRGLYSVGKTCALLRRNTHRLEKGLIMRPQRDVFAEDYIGETVDCYVRAVASDLLCEEERKWATDVLHRYFHTVGTTPKIMNAREKFRRLAHPGNDSLQYMPYPHSSLGQAPVDFDQLYQLCVHRRSVRWFQEKPVPDDVIARATSVATLAPSACNRQPFVFKVANGPEKAVALAKLAGGTAGYCENIPCMLAVVGNLDAYPLERDRHLIYIDASLAAMQLMLAVESLGLASCPINWPDVEDRERSIATFLSLQPFQRVIMLVAVGYADPDGGVPYSQKKSPDLLIEPV